MARFDRQIEMALRLIKKNGEAVIWRSQEDIKDPLQPWKPTGEVKTEHDVEICFLPLDRVSLETFALMMGTEVPRGMFMGYMGKVDFEPNIKDLVVRNGKAYKIWNMDVLSPNEQTILYTVIFQQ